MKGKESKRSKKKSTLIDPKPMKKETKEPERADPKELNDTTDPSTITGGYASSNFFSNEVNGTSPEFGNIATQHLADIKSSIF